MIVCFPKKNMGKVTASDVARLMVTTVPSIRMGLMVGIGGGVPRSNKSPVDIRLGDVVVSVPSGNTGRVVQYDFGKEEERLRRKYFRRTGSLD